MNKIIKLLFLLLLTPHFIYAAVTAKVDYPTVELGDMVTYYLDISGEDIVRPNIKRVCDSDVISTSSQTSVQIINGAVKKSYILSYRFVPQKSCVIEPVEIEIGGKKELSNPVSVKVNPVSGAKDLDFMLTLSIEKKELFVGETFDLTLTFKQKTNFGAVDSEFTAPDLKGFWLKNESKPQRSVDGEYTTTKLIYTMAPQREGKLNIKKAQMKIASRSTKADSWGAWIPTIKWKTYFSNELEIDVKPLPEGVGLIGDFKIKASAEKKEVNANEAVNITIEVVGNGNLEDVKSFKPFIDGVTVFDEKIVIQGTKLTQNIAFVAERDFTIPPFTLKYFDTQTKEIKTISSDAIDIKVKNSKAKEELTIKRGEKIESTAAQTTTNSESNSALSVVTFIIGLILGSLIMLFKPFKKVKKERSSSIKEPKILLMKLLPYKDDKEVQELIDTLEKSIYSNQKIDVEKKILKEILKKYKID